MIEHGRRTGTGWSRALAATGTALMFAGLSGCDRTRPPTERERRGVMDWLTCQECTGGERAFVVDSLGGTVIPLLEQALVGLDSGYRDNVAWVAGANWGEIESPAIDSLTYVTHFLGNFDATVQRRAAMALADLGATDILEDALAPGFGTTFRDDVIAVIRRSLDAALVGQGGPPLAPARVEVTPSSLALPVGGAALLEAVVLDASDQPVLDSATWSSSDSAVAAVTAQAAFRAEVRGEGVGVATVRAETPNGTAGEATVTVSPPVADTLVSIVSGDIQTDTVGRVLKLPLVVKVVDGHGTEVNGARVDWVVRYGGAVFTSTGQGTAATLTLPDGTASVSLRLGPNPGRVAVNATLANGRSVRFTHRAVH